jgi:hypothetical protein
MKRNRGGEPGPLGTDADQIPTESVVRSGQREVLEGLRCGRNSFWVMGEGGGGSP